jgi:hypothetical protein
MKKRQQGLTTVEAAIGAALMLIILFATIEIARAIFVYNYLDEVTRRGARVAAVCPAGHDDAKRVAVFADPYTNANNSPHINRLDKDDVEIYYLGADGQPATTFEDIKYVRACIPSFDLPLLLFNKKTLRTPEFRTILPSESLGFNPDLGTCECFDEGGPYGTDGCGPLPSVQSPAC